MWLIIVLIVVFVLVPIIMNISGMNSTYGVMHYKMHKVFTGDKAACENWIENLIKQEKDKLIKEMENMCLDNNLPKQDISQELNLLEIGLRQSYIIVRLN